MTAQPAPQVTAAPPEAPSGTPPQTLAELRALAQDIAQGDAPVALGARARATLARMLDLGGDPALLSITRLAERLSVSPSTLTRLARSLGYPGFPALQKVLLSASLPGTGTFYSQRARAALEGGGSLAAGVARLCRENQDNIGRFADTLDEASLAAAVELIVSAPRIAVHGIRQFHAVASFLVYGLRMIRADVSLLDSSGLGVAEGLALVGADGLLISTSCAPYSAQVIAVAAEARRLGMATIALTDRANSKLAVGARAALLVPHETSFLSNSIGGFIVAVECLVNACAAASPDTARRALHQRDLMIGRLGIEQP